MKYFTIPSIITSSVLGVACGFVAVKCIERLSCMHFFIRGTNKKTAQLSENKPDKKSAKVLTKDKSLCSIGKSIDDIYQYNTDKSPYTNAALPLQVGFCSGLVGGTISPHRSVAVAFFSSFGASIFGFLVAEIMHQKDIDQWNSIHNQTNSSCDEHLSASISDIDDDHNLNDVFENLECDSINCEVYEKSDMRTSI